MTALPPVVGHGLVDAGLPVPTADGAGARRLVGPADTTLNPAPRLFVVLPAWLGLASLLAGPLWRLNPLRALSRFLNAGASEPGPDPPADRRRAVGVLLAVAVVETSAATPTGAAATLLAYAAVARGAAVAVGPRWYGRFDAVELYSDVLGLAAPLVRDTQGRLS